MSIHVNEARQSNEIGTKGAGGGETVPRNIPTLTNSFTVPIRGGLPIEPSQTTPTPSIYPIDIAGTADNNQSLSSGAVAGIVLAIIAFLACASIALLWRIRRRRLHSRAQIFDHDAEMNHAGRTILPFTFLVEDRGLGTGIGNAMGTGKEFDVDTRSTSTSTAEQKV
ncbi:hypothetical protein MSAN_01097700 [Mycena sanguinolenta]|uniref:Uncharacterized protein n=1 Tax=Mycena sanguinolenta TaxID=230812 RepID=A0A8H6YT34_9AGAR|nr:hypothetical protein MSAN_01097700 [Mycena sanguinolenta]